MVVLLVLVLLVMVLLVHWIHLGSLGAEVVVLVEVDHWTHCEPTLAGLRLNLMEVVLALMLVVGLPLETKY